MTVRRFSVALGALVLTAARAASAQTPITTSIGDATFTLYGDVDLYLNYMHSSSGADILAIQDGAILRSRIGVRGELNLGTDFKTKFALEQGVNATSGAFADATRMFDRQLWIGLVTPVGEIRVGRQNTTVFYRGDNIDYCGRTLCSVVNAFGIPARYDTDVAYISPRMAGVQLEGHYSIQGSIVDHPAEQRVYQVSVDYEKGPFRIGYLRVAGKPASGTPIQDEVTYDNFFANYNYGAGKAYLVYIRSNNNGPTDVLFNGSSPLGGTGALVSGMDAGAETTYNIFEASADYVVVPDLRVGALVGTIRDSDSGTDKNATGGSAGAFYVIKNITLYAFAELLDNDRNAGFRPIGSAGLTKPFTAPEDVNGRTIVGAQTGLVYRF